MAKKKLPLELTHLDDATTDAFLKDIGARLAENIWYDLREAIRQIPGPIRVEFYVEDRLVRIEDPSEDYPAA